MPSLKLYVYLFTGFLYLFRLFIKDVLGDMSQGTEFERTSSTEQIQDSTCIMHTSSPQKNPERGYTDSNPVHLPGRDTILHTLWSDELLLEREQRKPSCFMCEEVCSLLQASLPICPEYDPPLLGFGRLRSPFMLSSQLKHIVLFM